MGDARFLLRPRWLLSHVLVLLLIVTMVNLGFWQLRRLDQRRTYNALVESRRDQPVVAIDQLVGPASGGGAVDRARYRTVTATGTYDDAATVTVRNRSQDGVPGAWLLTPLREASGVTVGVVRGFVGFEADGSIVSAPAPRGRVTVRGLAVNPHRFDGTAPKDLAPFLARRGVLPAVLLAARSSPPEPSGSDVEHATTESIIPVPAPALSEGPHLSYAFQWFTFSLIAIVGYPIILRRVVIRRGKEVDDEGAEGTDGAPAQLGNRGG